MDKMESPLQEDPREDIRSKWPGAVLLRDEIQYYCEVAKPPLISPFNPKELKSASYRLHLGKHCRVDGQNQELSKDKFGITIPPHGLAVVSTLEEVNIPGFLIARWNLKVKKVYQGLMWVGGPQVDS